MFGRILKPNKDCVPYRIICFDLASLFAVLFNESSFGEHKLRKKTHAAFFPRLSNKHVRCMVLVSCFLCNNIAKMGLQKHNKLARCIDDRLMFSLSQYCKNGLTNTTNM